MSHRWMILAVALAPVLGGLACAPAAGPHTGASPVRREAPESADSVRVLLCGWPTCDLVTMPAIERVLPATPQVPTRPAIQPRSDGRGIPRVAPAPRGGHWPGAR